MNTPSRVLPIACMVFGLAGAMPGHAQDALAFLTSSTGTGNLGSWPDAAGATGASAGDAICRAHAQRAGLANTGTFVAWLSTSTDDAGCRIRGLGGRLVDNCGLPEGALPVAGPWKRVDGTPFMDHIDAVIERGRLFRALELTEAGTRLAEPANISAFTATGPDGAVDTLNGVRTCADWTSSVAGDDVPVGSAHRTTEHWTARRAVSCGAQARLLCLDTSSAAPIRPREYGRPVFLSATWGSGDLSTWALAGGASGVEGADAVCRSEAQAAGLPLADTFKAWLSSSVHPAPGRFAWDGPWARLDGMRIADSIADLVDGDIRTSINLTAVSPLYQPGFSVLSGTFADGSGAVGTCDDWTSDSFDVTKLAGRSNMVQSQWTWHDFPPGFPSPCSSAGRLYCFADSDQLFADDGEWPRY
jgi:hypothetical protein